MQQGGTNAWQQPYPSYPPNPYGPPPTQHSQTPTHPVQFQQHGSPFNTQGWTTQQLPPTGQSNWVGGHVTAMPPMGYAQPPEAQQPPYKRSWNAPSSTAMPPLNPIPSSPYHAANGPPLNPVPMPALNPTPAPAPAPAPFPAPEATPSLQQQQPSKNGPGRPPGSLTGVKAKCSICHELGHAARACPHRDANLTPAAAPPSEEEGRSVRNRRLPSYLNDMAVDPAGIAHGLSHTSLPPPQPLGKKKKTMLFPGAEAAATPLGERAAGEAALNKGAGRSSGRPTSRAPRISGAPPPFAENGYSDLPSQSPSGSELGGSQRPGAPGGSIPRPAPSTALAGFTAASSDRNPADVAAAREAAEAAARAGLSNTWDGWDDEEDVSDEEDRMLVQRSMADPTLYRWAVEDPSQQLLDRCNDLHTELLKYDSEERHEAGGPTDIQVVGILRELMQLQQEGRASLKLLDQTKLGRTFANLRKNSNPEIARIADQMAVKWEETAALVVLKAKHGLEVKRNRVQARRKLTGGH